MKAMNTKLIKDKIFYSLVCLLAGLTIIPLFVILWEVIQKGYKQLNLDFITKTAPDSFEAMMAVSSGEVIPGGIVHGFVGTILMIVIAAFIAIPIGIMIGIFLYEKQENKFASWVRFTSDIIQGTPSIVIGIIVYSWIVKPLGGYSALAGGISLAIMMIPMIIRSTEETLKMLPSSLKEAGLALGASYTTIILKVILPSAFGGISTGILLAISRIGGETAPLIVTALGSSIINLDIMEPSSAIPLLIWEFYNDPNLLDLIWSSSLCLLIFIFIMNLSAKHLSKKWRIQ